MNEEVGVQRVSDHNMGGSGTTITSPNFIPNNLIDYAILLQQQAPSMQMSCGRKLWGLRG
jgi:hypothetical protein